MSARIAAAVPSSSSRYVQALALGDTRGLDDLDWETLRATGLTHLIAISGFHVGMVAALFALLGVGLWRMFRSEEHTSELQSLMPISYADYCLTQKTNTRSQTHTTEPSTSTRDS